MSSKKLNPFKDFQSDQIQRSACTIFTAHYACRNAALNLTPVTGTTNRFIFQIINSLIESWGYAWPVFCKFHAPALWSGRTQHKNVLFLNLNTVLSDPQNFANIWQIEENWIRSMKFETVRIHLLNDVFGLLSSRNFTTMATWRNDFSFLYNILVTLLNVLICTSDTVGRN